MQDNRNPWAKDRASSLNPIGETRRLQQISQPQGSQQNLGKIKTKNFVDIIKTYLNKPGDSLPHQPTLRFVLAQKIMLSARLQKIRSILLHLMQLQQGELCFFSGFCFLLYSHITLALHFSQFSLQSLQPLCSSGSIHFFLLQLSALR